ncbi:ComF family protein [soil metagenome]
MLTWIFRPQCAACGTSATTLCEPCAATLLELGPACPRCAEPTTGGAACARCVATPLPLEQILAPWRFGGQLAAAIRRLKFAQRTHIARDLAPLWAPLIAAVAGAHDAPVVPIPMHWRRRLRRGYDHAWLLGLHACKSAGIAPPRALLRRIIGAPAQSTLDAVARRANLEGAFVVRDRRAVTGRTIILVDDVVTTGATLAAATRALLGAGATAVIGVALARATSVPG